MTAILVVEDEAIVARDLEATLTRLGYSVPGISAAGEDAVRRARDLKPDLMLLDIHLAGQLDGIDVAGRMQEMEVPVVYLTAFADEGTLDRARATEPYGYLLKPFNELELRTTIEIALFKHSAQKRLRERARHFENSLDSLGEAIITTDLFGRVTHLNPAAEDLTGWGRDAALGRRLNEVCVVERLTEGVAAAGGEVEEAVARERRTSILTSRQGRKVVVEDGVTSILDHDNTVMGMVLVVRDVTEARHARESLALTERLSSIGTMVGGISHEINNPLAYLIANLDFAKHLMGRLAAQIDRCTGDTAGATEELKQLAACLLDADEGAQRIRRTVSDLGAFSEPRTAGWVRLDPSGVLATAATMMRSEIETRARFHVDIRSLPPITGVEARLVQAFAGLLGAAANCIRPGNPDDNEVTIEAEATGSLIQIVVSDTGPAMSPAEQRHLFDPFFVREGDRMGSGLAMWISNRVLTEHRALIRLESEGERGNRYVVTLRVDGRGDPPAA